MDDTPTTIWIDACAHRLQRQWPHVDPVELEEVAADLWKVARLLALSPAKAAADWLEPIDGAAPAKRP